MAVSDREIDRVMQFGLEYFDWFWVVVELATGRRRDAEEAAPFRPDRTDGEERA